VQLEGLVKKAIITVLVLFTVVVLIFVWGSCSNSGPGVGWSGDFYVEEKGTSVIVDSKGNIHVTGMFSGSPDFDPGPSINHRVAGDISDTFISKFDSSGILQWVTVWNGQHGYSWPEVSVVGNSIYAAGAFYDDVDLDPGLGVDVHRGSGVHLSKFNNNGEYLWANSWDAGSAHKIDVDENGNIYITGSYHNWPNKTVDFDPGANEIIFNEPCVYVSKFDSDGNPLWVRTWGYMEGTSMAVEANGDTYLTGIFHGTKDFDPGSEVFDQAGNYSAFLCKLDSGGNFSWVRTFEGTSWGASICITIDPNSNVIIQSTYPWISRSNENIFLKKYDSDGSLLWEHKWGWFDNIDCLGLTVDDNGNIYTTGFFTGKVDFDPGPSTDEHRSRGPGVYLSKFDPAGNFQWVRTWGGTGWDKGNGIAYDNNGYIYVTGEFCNRVDFDPGSGEDWHKSTSYDDIFLSKFDLDGNFIWARTWGGENPIVNY